MIYSIYISGHINLRMFYKANKALIMKGPNYISTGFPRLKFIMRKFNLITNWVEVNLLI